jgi:branched-chain amino acid transport system ATP-binding protein
VSLLQVEELDAGYGLLHAVRGMSFTVDEGRRLALVGANGAGKSTLLRCIAGAHSPSSGTIRFDGADITQVAAHRRVRLGISLVPEGRRLFPDLTVVENLLVAGARSRSGEWTVERALDAFPVLRQVRDQRALTLSGGQQQMAAIARGLMTNPRLLLLDEVSLGLSPVAVQGVYDSLARLGETRTAIVLVEQDLTRAMGFADQVACVLEGRIVLTGSSDSLTRDQVTAAYFGLDGRSTRHDA